MAKLDQYATFVQVIHNNSFTKTANILGVSNTAVSKQIAALEKKLGIQLLRRTTRKITLTDAGKLVYENCRRIIDDLDELESTIEFMQAEPAGVLRIITPVDTGQYILLPLIGEFSKKYPKLRFEVELADRFPDLEKEEKDIVFGIGKDGPVNLVRKKLPGNFRHITCASAEYLKEYGAPKTLEDLKNHQIISHVGHEPGATFFFKDQEISPKAFLKLNNTQAVLNAVKLGMGIGQLSNFLAKESLANNQIQEVLHKFVQNYIPIYLYYQQSRYVQPKIRKFIDFAMEYMQKNM